jgi:hypothetical protein
MVKKRIDRVDRVWKMRGYNYRYRPEHPFSYSKGAIGEHRLIAEEHLRENHPNHPALVNIDGELYLSRKWDVHHKNMIRDDNRIENLEPLLPEIHSKIRNRGWIDGITNNLSKKRYGDKHRVRLVCANCKIDFETTLSLYKRGRKYCTIKCRGSNHYTKQIKPH